MIKGKEEKFLELFGRRPIYSEEYGAWIIADPEQVTKLLKNEEISANREASFLDRVTHETRDSIKTIISVREELLFFMEGKEHQELRTKFIILIKSLIKNLDPDLDILWAKVWRQTPSTHTFDLVEDVVEPNVQNTFQLMLRCPNHVAKMLKTWSGNFSDTMSGSATDQDYLKAENSCREIYATLETELSQTWCTEIFNNVDASFSENEKRRSILLLFLAGYETTISMLINSLHFRVSAHNKVLSHNDALNEVCPVTFTMREAKASINLGGKFIEKGDRVLFSWVGANSVQPQLRNFTFGYGRHSCPGKSIATYVISSCFRKLDETPNALSLVGDVQYNDNLCFRYPKNVQVQWE